MGFRFRKTVKICKGVRINFSKSGASLSLGGRGHSVNIGKRSRVTIGIPGTGLSYSSSLSGNNKSNRSSSSRSRSSNSGSGRTSTVILPSQFSIVMNNDGKIEIRDNNDNIITDPSVIRKIKSSDSYKNMVQKLELQRQERLNEIYDEAIAENDKFIKINRQSPQVDWEEQYIHILNNLRPQEYIRKEYDVPCPTEEEIRERLESEAIETVKGSIFRIKKLRREYVESNLQERTNAEIAKWTADKEQFDAAEERTSIAENKRYNEDFKVYKQYVEDRINGDEEVINSAVESWISSCVLPVEINVDYEWFQGQHLMYLDVDLPEIEDIPENEVVKQSNGNLKEKKKTQATLKQEYVNLVFGLAVFISANIFNISPAIYYITISGYTQRRNKIGDISDEYIYSIKFIRSVFEKTNLQYINPKDFCMTFENRCNMTTTMLMKKIVPYEVD
ncbi:MAG: DUF4236 domain-containing protein [Ruminococcus sp.]|nr:DUF4236 domain-containing protein [Ruminococcus sp.]